MSMDDDKISQLPQHILHHILCFLSHKEAVQTSVLSKSWRYLGPTRPKIEFCVQELEETHPYVLDEILQRYHDQKLSIQQFIVKINIDNSIINPLLEKWVPIVVTNMGAKTLNLDLGDFNPPFPSVVFPSSVFQAAEFLEELYLCNCKLSRIEPTDKLLLRRLRKVSLIEVYLEDETFEKIISSCPLIEYLVMDCCMGLRIIRVNNNNNNLKHFEFSPDLCTTRDNCSIEIGHVPSLETIRVDGYPNWFDHLRLCFTHLKSLCLTDVCLSMTKSIFDNFSSDFPSLEDLTLNNCYGFQEFKLSSRSIKRLDIANPREPIKATIDTPNLLYFKYCHFLQSSISFAASCGHEWESYIVLYNFLGDADNSDDRGGSSSWLYKIHEVVKAFSQSKISMHLSQRFEIPNPEKVLLDNSTYTELVVVEQLSLDTSYSSLSIAALTKCLLRILRPRYIIVEYHWLSNDEAKLHVVESLNKILVAERGRGAHFWPQDLEDMIMEDINLAKGKWEPLKIGFRLKWKETEMS